MTPENLETALAEEIKKLFDGFRQKNSIGEYVPLNIWEDCTPLKTDVTDSDGQSVIDPYIVVRAVRGTTSDPGAHQNVTVDLIICVYDDETERQGMKDLHHIIRVISLRFQKEPLLAGAYSLLYPIDWMISDEDTYPFYFGGMEFHFELPVITRENDLA